MRRINITIILMLVLLALSLPAVAYAGTSTDEEGPIDQVINKQINSDGIKKIENEIVKRQDKDFKIILDGFDPEKLVGDSVRGKFELSLKGIIERCLSYLLKEVYANIGILVKLLVIILLCSILKNLQASFLSEGVGELAFYACYIVMVGVLVAGFSTAMKMGMSIIDSMVVFMETAIPVLVTLMISGGNFASAGAFQPILIMIVDIAALIMKNVLLPLIFLTAILSVVGNISDKVQISKLTGLLKQISLWTMGTILTLFIAFITVQGTLGAAVDGVTGKTAKFAIGTFIPVAGKYLADAADAVVGCTLLIKNAAGVAVMCGIVSICLIPILKIFAIMLLYRLTGVLVEPVSEKRIVNLLNDISGSFTYLIGIVASVAFMFLISITAMINAGNVSTMIR